MYDILHYLMQKETDLFTSTRLNNLINACTMRQTSIDYFLALGLRKQQIIQEELLAVLTMMVGANISPEQLLSIAERTILEADEDKDELISFEEFVKVQLL